MRTRWSFRAKLLVALVGSVGVLLGITLFVVQRETERQIAATVERTTERARAAFGEMERFRRDELLRFAQRLEQTQRLRAGLQSAIEQGDPSYLAQHTQYELTLAGIEAGLIAFTDMRGRPVLELLDRRLAPAADRDSVDPVIADMVAGGGVDTLAYRVADGRLFGAISTVVYFFGRPVGTLTFGLPVEDADAERLGEIAGAELCLVVGGRCIAATTDADSTLRARMTRMAGGEEVGRGRWRGERWVLTSEALSRAAGDRVWRVMAIPLEDVLRPFDHIQDAARFGGLAALALALIVGIVLSRGLTRPIRSLVAATERVARGEFDVRVEVASRDEIGALARAFNEMTSGLLLKEQYRGVLDKIVSREVAEELLSGGVELGGETREVATLFADVRGFTALSAEMDPEDVVAMLNEFMARASAVVEAEGGVVDKYVGDEIMAIFGAPMRHGDDALRAVRAAVRMRDELDRLNTERRASGRPPIEVGIGINTGRAVAGNVGSSRRLNYTVIGASVNLAARLCQAAGPAEILISGETRRRVGERVVARDAGRRTLKGVAEPVPVYAVESVRMGGRDGPGAGADAHSSSRKRPAPAEEQDASRGFAADEGTGDGSGGGTDGGDAGGGGVTGDADDSGGGASGGVARSVGSIVLLLAALVFGSVAPASAQGGPFDLPTLAELGVGYISPSGYVQISASGRLDVEGYAPGGDPAWIIPERDPFVAGRARVFVDLLVGSELYGMVELRADRGEAPAAGGVEARIEQAFLRFTPSPTGAVAAQAGIFVSPFGAYPQRHHTEADAFIRPPLLYDYRTMACAGKVPSSNDAFIRWKDAWIEAPGEPRRHMFRPTGAPIVWGAPYQLGAMLFGGRGPVSYRIGVMNSAPSSEPDEWDLNLDQAHGPSYVAHVAVQLLTELRVGASYNRGPWLRDETIDMLPSGGSYGRGIDAYDQEMLGLEATFARGPIVARGEAVYDRWEMPNVIEVPTDFSYYGEVQWTISPGLFAAVRYNAIDFNEIALSTPAPDGSTRREQWDFDIRRWQLGAGYRLSRNTEIRVEYARNETLGPWDPSDDLLSLQWWWAY